MQFDLVASGFGLVEGPTDDEDGGLEAVKTMTPTRKAIGFKEGISDFTGTINHKILIPREFDYQAAKENRTELLIVYQERAGNLLGDRFLLKPARVKGVSRGYNAEGDAMDVVTFVALDHKRERLRHILADKYDGLFDKTVDFQQVQPNCVSAYAYGAGIVAGSFVPKTPYGILGILPEYLGTGTLEKGYKVFNTDQRVLFEGAHAV